MRKREWLRDEDGDALESFMKTANGVTGLTDRWPDVR